MIKERTFVWLRVSYKSDKQYSSNDEQEWVDSGKQYDRLSDGNVR